MASEQKMVASGAETQLLLNLPRQPHPHHMTEQRSATNEKTCTCQLLSAADT